MSQHMYVDKLLSLNSYNIFRFHPQNVLGIRQFADTLGCRSLVKAADKFIEQYFHEVSLSDEYVCLGMNDVVHILQRNELHVDRQVFPFKYYY